MNDGAGWRIRLRTGTFMGLAWVCGAGVGLGWGVVLTRDAQRCQATSRGSRAVAAATPVSVAAPPPASGPALGARPIPRGLICYPPCAEQFAVPDHLRPRSPLSESLPYVTRTEVAHVSPSVAASSETPPQAPKGEFEVPRAVDPQLVQEPLPEEELDPAELARAEAELAKVRIYRAQTARIQALVKQARTADEWVLRAIMAQELALLGDLRVIEPLSALLDDGKVEVVYFTLLGLAEFSGQQLRQGGGHALALALHKTARSSHRDVRSRAYALLRRLSGEDLPARSGAWKRWIAEHAAELKLELNAPVFDEGAYDPRVVARVRTGSGTRVRTDPSQIPGLPVFSELDELQRRGLDLVVCLDQTSSMEAVIQAAKGNLGVFGSVLGALVKRNRLGLVVFKDGVTGRMALGQGSHRFREALEPVRAGGGGDVEEGVDKAVASALLRDMGWRRESSKVVVIVGDAPPHAADVASLLHLGKLAHAEQGVVFHAIDCGGLGADVAQLARDSSGALVRLTTSDSLIYQILSVVFGEAMRPAVERFLDTYLEWSRA